MVGLVTKLCTTLATSWTVACQAPLFMRFSRQEYWSGLPFPSSGDLPDPGMEPGFPALQAVSCIADRFFIDWTTRKAPGKKCLRVKINLNWNVLLIQALNSSPIFHIAHKLNLKWETKNSWLWFSYLLPKILRLEAKGRLAFPKDRKYRIFSPEILNIWLCDFDFGGSDLNPLFLFSVHDFFFS